MNPASQKIYVGGWERFRMEAAVTKKEAVEDFSWMGRAAADYNECRDVLTRIEGAKEYLKNYVAVEEGSGTNFNDPIGNQIELGSHHSGASHFGMLWSYKALLNDWDGWVLAEKERKAYQEYKMVQVGSEIITGLYYAFTQFLNGDRTYYQEESDLLEDADVHGLEGNLQVVHGMVAHLFREHMERMKLQNLQRKQRQHNDLMGGLKHKYRQPSRWFDYTWGSSILPGTPQEITPEAYAQMEQLYPGYREHIQRVERARRNFQLPPDIRRYSLEGEAFVEDLMRRFQVIV
jgi:hypothetical protein